MVIASLFIAIEGIWGPGLFRHWSFVTVVGALLLAIAAILSLKTVWQSWKILLAATHIPGKKKRLVFTILAFLAVQMTWYGVNYLPAANYSLHTYTQEPIL